jgi:hypothetical protein
MPEEVKPGEGQQGAAGSEQKPGEKNVPFNEHPRWREVYGELQEFKKLGGSPADISARLQEAEELKATLEREAAAIANEKAQQGGTSKEVNAVFEAARAELRKLLPEIDAIANIQAAQQAHYGRLEKAALSETKKVLDSAGLPTTADDITAMSDILADVIRNDEDLFAEYETNPREAVRGAWKQYIERVRPAVERQIAASKQKDRESLRTLPRAHGAGGGEAGGGGEKPPEPAKTLKEAEARAMARLRGSRED